jgi:anthranilate phosphoribosyltransferase
VSINFKDAIGYLNSSETLSSQALDESIQSIFSGTWNEIQIGSFLVALNIKGINGETLGTLARFLRKNSLATMFPSAVQNPTHLLTRPIGDNCGTGGDGIHTFNISTLSAIVAAAGGLRIAKHGNRSISSLCGSADLLFYLGYPESLSLDQSIGLLEETGLTFLFAPQMHPVMKTLAPIRKSLGIPTVFNYVGPLSNPLNPNYQLIGVNHKNLLHPMAEALINLGVENGLIIHSRDGLDEISPNTITDGIRIADGKKQALEIDPETFGIRGELKDLKGGDASMNAELLWRILNSEPEVLILSQTICLNVAIIFWIAKKVESLEEGFHLAQSIIKTNKARDFLKSWLLAAKKLP